MQSELPDLVLLFYVLYFFSIVFKTRKSIEEYNTGHRHSCESQLEALHWFHCSLLCCNWLFRNENGETGMRKRSPLDGSTDFCCAVGNFCLTCKNLPRIIRGRT